MACHLIYPIPGDSVFKDVLDCTMKNNTTTNHSLRYYSAVSLVVGFHGKLFFFRSRS